MKNSKTNKQHLHTSSAILNLVNQDSKVGLNSGVSFLGSSVSTQRIQTMTKTAIERQSKFSGLQSMPWLDCSLREQQPGRTQTNLIIAVSPTTLIQESQNHGNRKHEAIQSVKPKLLALIYRRNAFSRPATGMWKCLYPISTLRPDTALNPKKTPSLHDGIALCMYHDKSPQKTRSVFSGLFVYWHSMDNMLSGKCEQKLETSVDASCRLSAKHYAENGFSGEKYGQNMSVAYSFLRVGKIVADTRLQC